MTSIVRIETDGTTEIPKKERNKNSMVAHRTTEGEKIASLQRVGCKQTVSEKRLPTKGHNRLLNDLSLC